MKVRFLQQAFNNIKIRRKLFILSVAIICFVIIVASVALYNEYLDNQNNFKLVEQTVRGNYDILKSTDVYTRLAEYVLSHHERWDGKGYPRGLFGEQIPLGARIITVADAYEAMTASRTYKEPLTHEQAIAELKKFSGTQFNSEVVLAFEKCYINSASFV